MIELDRAAIENAIEKFVNTIKSPTTALKLRSRIASIADESIKGAHRYLKNDIERWGSNFHMEQFICREDTLGNPYKVQGSLDIVGVNEETKTIDIVDWKRVGILGSNKVLKYANSWQPVLYLNYYRHTHPEYDAYFTFRFYVESETTFQEIRFTMTPDELDARMKEIQTYDERISASALSGIWARNPDNCFQYGRYCMFYDHCWSNVGELVQIENPMRSQSLYNMYASCNRRYAYTMQLCQDDALDYHDVEEGSLPALLGSMFHAGAENIWEQAKIQLTNNDLTVKNLP